jgi:uncharacterized protein YfbU (UPF0304 family)
MDKDTKRMLGFILGQIYRLQKRLDPAMCPASDAEIYGLTHGFEYEIEKVLYEAGEVSDEQVTAAVDVLDPLFRLPKPLSEVRGYHDLEPRFEKNGLDRATVIRCLKYLAADGQFMEVIGKLDSEHSPEECRRFELWATEK